MDDAGEVTFKDVRFIEPEGEGKKQIFPYKSKSDKMRVRYRTGRMYRIKNKKVRRYE